MAVRELFVQRCVNSCGGNPNCRHLACCHDCMLHVRDVCTNDGTYAFVPRYFARLARA